MSGVGHPKSLKSIHEFNYLINHCRTFNKTVIVIKKAKLML